MSHIIQRNAGRLAEVEEFQQEQGGGPPQGPQRSLLSILWNRRWTVFAFTLVGIIGGFAYILTATPIYTAGSRIYVERSGPRILNETRDNVSASRPESFLYTQAELIRSAPILAAAAEAVGADKMQTFGDGSPVAVLATSLDVQVGKKDDLITVTFDTPFPEEGAKIVNGVVDAFLSYQSQHTRSTASDVLKILRKEKEQRDAELDTKMKAMVDFKTANVALSFQSDNWNIVTQRLGTLQDALTRSQMETLDAKASYESAVAMNNAGKLRQQVDAQARKGWYVSSDQLETALRAQLDNSEIQAQSMRSIYSPEHRLRLSAESVVIQLREKLVQKDKEFAEGYIATAKEAWTTAQGREKELQKAFDEQLKLAMDLNAKAAEYGRLDTEYKRLTILCDTIDNRIKEIAVTEDTGAMNISVLEVAKVADRPSKPQKTRSLAMAMVLGLMAGLGCALIRDWMDERLQSSEEIQAALDLPILGVIPHIAGNKTAQAAGQMIHLEPRSETAEAYRTVRTAIYFGVPAGQAKTLLVTSPAPADGKTTSAANIAIAMAQAGQKVLLIDADFRKPRQQVIFQLEGDAGLSAALAERCTTEEAIRPTGIKGLDVLPCGPIPANPTELLHSQRFQDLLKSLSERYDHVVIDSPPVMPVTDARILGARCDVTVLVLRAEKSTRRMAEQARDGLLSVGARILGVVVNDAVHGRGGYGYYSSRYGYGYGGYGGYGASPNGNGKALPADALAHSDQPVA